MGGILPNRRDKMMRQSSPKRRLNNQTRLRAGLWNGDNKIKNRRYGDQHEWQCHPEYFSEGCSWLDRRPVAFQKRESHISFLSPIEIPQQSSRNIQNRRSKYIRQPGCRVTPISEHKIEVIRPTGRKHPQAQSYIQMLKRQTSSACQKQNANDPWRAQESQHCHEESIKIVPCRVTRIWRDKGNSCRRNSKCSDLPRDKKKAPICRPRERK